MPKRLNKSSLADDLLTARTMSKSSLDDNLPRGKTYASSPAPDPRVTAGWFRHPDIDGEAYDPICGYRWADHGWIDSSALSKIIQPSGIAHGLTVCPSGPWWLGRRSGQLAQEPEPANSEEKFSLSDARVGDTIHVTRTSVETFTFEVQAVDERSVYTTLGRFDFEDDTSAEHRVYRLVKSDPLAEAAAALVKATLPAHDGAPVPNHRKIIENLAADGWTLHRSAT